LLAVLAPQDFVIMDELCAQTRVQLKEDPNAMEFFNSFSSAENIRLCDDIKRQMAAGYEPGGHRVTALRDCLASAVDFLAIAFSNSFFSHSARTTIGNDAAVTCFKASRALRYSSGVLQSILSVWLARRASRNFSHVRCHITLLCIFNH
jgi:hypothetical protein